MNPSNPNRNRLATWFWKIISWPAALGFLIRSTAQLRTARVSKSGPGVGFTGPAVYVNWHRYVPFLCIHHGQYRRWLMVSAAPYMDAIAHWCKFCGLTVVRGATGEGGRQALAPLTEALKRGESVFLAVDGPAGPAFKAKRGCVDLARAACVPIIPVAYRTQKGKINPRRWDQWLPVKMFDTIQVHYGSPVFIDPSELDAEALARVQQSLEQLEREVLIEGN